MKDDRERRDEAEDQESSGGVDAPPQDGDSGPAAGEATGQDGSGNGAANGAVSEEVEQLRGELNALNDRHLRLAAEFDNYRKRNQREREALAARLQGDLISSLLEVLDDLERVAASAADATAESVIEGARLVEKKFVGVLEAAGLESLDAEGKRFDPEVMEALMTVPTDDQSRDDHVADVFQRGYRFQDRLVRPARVRVLKYDPDADGDA